MEKDITIETYLRDIGRVPLLDPEEEKELGRRIQQGDEKAREKMIRANLRLVVSEAKNYMNHGLPFHDLIEEGNMGLLKAVDRFDPEKGTRFSTYATWWIRQAIRRALTNKSKSVRIPAYMVQILSDFKSVRNELSQKWMREPSFSEVVEEMGLTGKKLEIVRRALDADHGPVRPASIDVIWSKDVYDDDAEAEMPEEIVINESEVERLYKMLDAISDRQADILRMRFGLESKRPMTLQQIGNKMGITRERVRQLEQEGLEKLQEAYKEAFGAEHLEEEPDEDNGND